MRDAKRRERLGRVVENMRLHIRSRPGKRGRVDVYVYATRLLAKRGLTWAEYIWVLRQAGVEK